MKNSYDFKLRSTQKEATINLFIKENFMEAKEIKKILKQFEEKDTYKKIFINGPWGIGKTYYIQEYIKENKGEYIYVSLFGRVSYDAIEDAIAIELMNKLNTLQKMSKKIENLSKKFNSSISYGGFSIVSNSMEKSNLFMTYSKLLQNKKLIIIIDDLERKSNNIQIEDIMGMVEQFSLFNNVKILIVGSESNMINDDKEKWSLFKEKLIEKEYNITKFSKDAINSIIISKIDKYIKNENLLNFIESFLKIHKTKNLRSIEKGVNLFLEIINNYLDSLYDENIYLTILKNCMAVAIEFSEGLYKPDETNENNKLSFENKLTKSIDKDIYLRIMSHYFNTPFFNNKETSILEYVIYFFQGKIDDEVIKDFNNVVKNYLSIEEKKSLFYFSEEKIELTLIERYNDINNYKFTTIEKFINDMSELVCWNAIFNLGFDFSIIEKNFNKILMENFYNIDKEEEQNKIKNFNNYKYHYSSEFEQLINKYNMKVTSKYRKDKIDRIVKKYKDNDLNLQYLEWLNWKLSQKDDNITEEYFLKCCRKNNYLIPNLSIEINENEMQWLNKLWDIFYERVSDNAKEEINAYIEGLKTNRIATFRINILQSYRPLIVPNKK